ncbi:hypothetical protein [Burkholderia diffusa]|uniref:hypothetical protein n=1 Tax=Burkholderia diffusa TaxID=488732 RepID=UPI000AC991C2|nr:hypothetical protein [Burkholderia diffusa]
MTVARLFDLESEQLSLSDEQKIVEDSLRWNRVIPFLVFPPGVRKIIKTRANVPTDKAAI